MPNKVDLRLTLSGVFLIFRVKKNYLFKKGRCSTGFTDKWHIFIDASVNGRAFAKCSAAHHLFNHCT